MPSARRSARSRGPDYSPPLPASKTPVAGPLPLQPSPPPMEPAKSSQSQSRPLWPPQAQSPADYHRRFRESDSRDQDFHFAGRGSRDHPLPLHDEGFRRVG